MAQTKSEIIKRLVELTGENKPEWEKLPVYKLLVELDLYKVVQPEPEAEPEDFRSKIHGSFR